MGARGLGRLDDPPRVVLVDGRGLRPHVGAMDREARERVAQGLVQLVARVVAVPATPLADLEEERGEPVQIAAHDLAHHLVLPGARHLGPVGRFARELGVELGQRLLALGVDEDPGDAVQEVVAGRAVDRPGVAQRLARLEDLLDDDPRLRPGVAQPVEIRFGVPQPVGVVDPEAIERTVGEPSEHETVRVAEDVIVLHAQAHQAVDVEESPVAEVARRRAPGSTTLRRRVSGGSQSTSKYDA